MLATATVVNVVHCVLGSNKQKKSSRAVCVCGVVRRGRLARHVGAKTVEDRTQGSEGIYLPTSGIGNLAL